MPEKKAAPQKRTRKAAAPRKTPATKKLAPKAPASPQPTPAAAPVARAKGSVEVCPRCGTEKFGPEQRIRAEGARTVRYRVLVCERGHTFARPRTR